MQNFIQQIVQPDCYLPSTQDHAPSSPLYNTSLWGPTCDGLDKICDVVMPELAVGDWLYFDNMGAYTVSAFSSFNGFLRPKIYYCVSETNWYAILLSCLVSYPDQPSLIPRPSLLPRPTKSHTQTKSHTHTQPCLMPRPSLVSYPYQPSVIPRPIPLTRKE